MPPPPDYTDYKRLEEGLAPRSRLEEGAGRSTLTLRKVRAVFELRHVEVELSFEQRPRGCGPSSNYDTIATGVWVRQTNPVC